VELAVIRAVVVALAVFFASSSAARAQSSPEDRARVLFERAIVELEAGRRDAAIAGLRESLEVHATPATAFNLAIALGDRGDVREGVEILRAVIDGRYGPVPAERIESARTTLASMRGNLALLELRIEGADAARLIVPGRTIEIAREPIVIAIPPGPVEVRVEADGRAAFVRALDLAPAADHALVATLAPTDALITPPPIESRSIAEEPAFWLVLGGSALALAAIGVGVFFAVQPAGPPDAFQFGTVSTLTLP
jgi:hypothetical protein